MPDILYRSSCGCLFQRDNFVHGVADIAWDKCPMHDAAPELLQALELFAEGQISYDNPNNSFVEMQIPRMAPGMAIAAITKAKGTP